MNIHEYQAKEIFRAHGIPVPPGEIATTRRGSGADRLAVRRDGGGEGAGTLRRRGKAGGVKLAKTAQEAREHASRILGMEINGLTVEKVLVTPAEDIESEAYVGVIVDRGSKSAVFMVSAEGGVDIEEVAETNPDAIRKLAVDPRFGLLPHQAYWLATELYDDMKQQRSAAKIIQQLYDSFVDAGASLAEINPLITTPSGEIKAIDAKMDVDDNELFRKPEIEALRDESSEDPAEVRAREAGLTFIKLDGDVGCCVNGAGLAMATMDLVKYYGGEPANFLDIGGSSNPEKVVNALRIITSDPGGEGHPLQHLRRDHPLRRRGQRHRHGHEADRHPGADRDPAHRDERGGGRTHPRGRGLQRDDRHGRRGGAGRDSGKGRGQVSIFIDKDTRLVVQGITGRDGSFHAKQMMEYGTQVVAGVTPGKGGQTFDGQVPIFNTVEQAVKERRQYLRHLRAAGLRRGRDVRGGRRRDRVHRLHHGRRTGSRHDRVRPTCGRRVRGSSVRTAPA
jgi:succinyl-CoA synthetase beta subunit